jgi:hypothetical protein
MIKKIEMPYILGIIVREPINIDEPIFLEDHLPYPTHPRGAVQNSPVINYPTALNFTKRIGTVDYVVNTHFAEDGTSTLLSQFRDLILTQKLTDDLP